MKRAYITGICGHLGNNLCQLLLSRGWAVCGLALPEEQPERMLPQGVVIRRGNVCEPATLSAFLQDAAGAVVFHTAGIVTIASHNDDRVWQVNVEGTANLLAAARRAGVARFVYVSSVHAIPEKPKGQVICETEHFDPAQVHGLYAKTKSAATASVLAAARNGMDTVVVHPSGILGPWDWGHGHLTQLVVDYMTGRLTACVRGGYDFVDVRDVALGMLGAAERGQGGQCYILSGHYASVPELLELLHQATGRRRVRTVLPPGFAKLTAPLAEKWYKLHHQPPLFTAYSLYTLETNAVFSHEKATAAWGYAPRPLMQTLSDTAAWLAQQGRV